MSVISNYVSRIGDPRTLPRRIWAKVRRPLHLGPPSPPALTTSQRLAAEGKVDAAKKAYAATLDPKWLSRGDYAIVAHQFDLLSLGTVISPTPWPALARRNLDFVVEFLEGIGVPYFGVEVESLRPRIAVPGRYRSLIWRELKQLDDPSVHVWLDQSNLARRFMTPSDAGKDHDTWVMQARLWRLFRLYTDPGATLAIGQDVGCELEFWDDTRAHSKIAPVRWNPVIPEIRDVEMARATQPMLGREVPVPAGLSHLPLYTKTDFPIDVVITWVDDSEPDWRALKASYQQEAGTVATPADSSVKARFKNRDELRYVLRSIWMFAPWVNHIYLATAEQVPAWLDVAHPGVSVVSHKEFFANPDWLPTFNSHAIESQIHRIAGLSEHYLYLNDDFFLGRPVGPEIFFMSNGLARVAFSAAHIALKERDDQLSVDRAASNSRDLVARVFGRTVGQKFRHSPYPQLRSVNYEIEKACADEWAATGAARFRSVTDVPMPSGFSHYFAYMTGRAVPTKIANRYIGIHAANAEQQLFRLLQERSSDTFCLNDAGSGADGDLLLGAFLDRYFPLEAPWEK